jgi:DNA-binding transcriptional ArsR family regulator
MKINQTKEELTERIASLARELAEVKRGDILSRLCEVENKIDDFESRLDDCERSLDKLREL